ncbi:uncharacterized protein LOC117120621, partial [Anneissia japonica]|uniref:uncharacterized protein LOC117120621 n=1 Tax=Anneissia japonica TaxID=1529436 RepID=UPI001425AAFF
MDATQKRFACLLEASRRGFTLKTDPSGSGNRCFYQCIASYLSAKEHEVFKIVQLFMLANQIVHSVEDGVLQQQNLFEFLSNADFPNLTERPATWEQCVIALQDQMASHVVIRAAATIFSFNCNIIDWRGRITVAKPFGEVRSGISDVFLAYTGDHYMLLTSNVCYRPIRMNDKASERHKGAEMFYHSGPEEYYPGISVFKGRPIKLDELSCESINHDTKDDYTYILSDESETISRVKKRSKKDIKNKKPQNTKDDCTYRCIISDDSEDNISCVKKRPKKRINNEKHENTEDNYTYIISDESEENVSHVTRLKTHIKKEKYENTKDDCTYRCIISDDSEDNISCVKKRPKKRINNEKHENTEDDYTYIISDESEENVSHVTRLKTHIKKEKYENMKDDSTYIISDESEENVSHVTRPKKHIKKEKHENAENDYAYIISDESEENGSYVTRPKKPIKKEKRENTKDDCTYRCILSDDSEDNISRVKKRPIKHINNEKHENVEGDYTYIISDESEENVSYVTRPNKHINKEKHENTEDDCTYRPIICDESKDNISCVKKRTKKRIEKEKPQGVFLMEELVSSMSGLSSADVTPNKPKRKATKCLFSEDEDTDDILLQKGKRTYINQTNIEKMDAVQVDKIPPTPNGTVKFQVAYNKKEPLSNICDSWNWQRAQPCKRRGFCKGGRRTLQICGGSLVCHNMDCAYNKIYKMSNKVDFSKRKNCLHCNQEAFKIDCAARKYVENDRCHKIMTVYYVGEHICSPRAIETLPNKDEVEDIIRTRPTITTGQIQLEKVREALLDGRDANEVECVAQKFSNSRHLRYLRSLVNEKSRPGGSDIEAVRLLKEDFEKRGLDHNLILEVGEDYVLLSSEQKLKMAALITINKINEPVSLDGCESHARDYTELELTTYVPVLRRNVKLANIFVPKPGENSENVQKLVEKFDKAVNEILPLVALEYNLKSEEFLGKGLDASAYVGDEGGALWGGLCKAKGDHIKNKTISDFFHFKQDLNRHKVYFQNDKDKAKFQTLMLEAYNAVTSIQADEAEKALEKLISKQSSNPTKMMNYKMWWWRRRVRWQKWCKTYSSCSASS